MATQKSTIVPKRSAIARHWYDKYQSYKEPPKFLKVAFVDLGEPHCWGCGYSSINWFFEWDFEKNGEYTLDHLFENFDNTSLERCHIIPKSRGGSSDLDNYVLLCERCHDEIPDTANPKYAMKWLNNRYSQDFDQFKQDIQNALSLLELDNDYMDKVLSIIIYCDQRKDEFDYFLYKFTAMHRPTNSRLKYFVNWLATLKEFYTQHYKKPPDEEYPLALERYKKSKQV